MSLSRVILLSVVVFLMDLSSPASADCLIGDQWYRVENGGESFNIPIPSSGNFSGNVAVEGGSHIIQVSLHRLRDGTYLVTLDGGKYTRRYMNIRQCD